MWIVTALSISGIILNIYKRRECFIVWCFTNAAWMAHDYYHGEYAQSFMFAVYFGLSIWGLLKWRTENTLKKPLN